jgi:hypothetical protein
MPRVENWSIVSTDVDPYRAPELKARRLSGIVSGHSTIEDGKFITSSSLVEFDYLNSKALTKNTVYDLGEINPEYKKWCDTNKIDLTKFQRSE